MIPADFHILVVDDDPAIRRVLSVWLEQGGYRVSQAEDGHSALAAIEAKCPDFLITDWEMPQLDGVELCNRVRKLDLPHYVYVVFLTAKSAPDELVVGFETGADDFLIKPVNRNELLARIAAGCRVLKVERHLSLMAHTDPLTGLMSRRSFRELLEKEWQRAVRHNIPLSCAITDIDFFKRINDIHGHAAGDQMLKSIAQVLTESCRTSDAVCRYGGEEFCAVLPETSEREAGDWCERIRRDLAALSVAIDGKTIRVTGSFGVAQRRDDVATPEALLDRADQALLCAKQSGRDRVVRFASLAYLEDAGSKEGGLFGDVFRGITAADVMSPTVVCLDEDDPVGQAAEFFLRSRISSSPVVDARGKLSGVVSEKDLMTVIVSWDRWNTPIREVMHPNVIAYEEDAPIRAIYEFLCRVSIRRVVVVKQGRPTGTVSRGTLLRWFHNLVAFRGLATAERLPASEADLDMSRSQERLAKTARELARQASDLELRFQEEGVDLVPNVVGGATRMQELVNDLLAHSRFANEKKKTAAPWQSLLVNTGHTD
jgi:diguanylate cyclase (GGDEF)-like protein